jgi:S1-C subfamily serine protease
MITRGAAKEGKMRTRRLLLSLLFLGLLIACTSTTQLQRASQKSVAPKAVQGSQPVAFYRLLIDVPAGTEVGAHYDGMARVRQYPYRWDAGRTAGSSEFGAIATAELQRSGYTVVGGAKESLFEENAGAKARFQLGATVRQLTYNTYAPLAGGFAESRVLVSWELYDSFSRRVVFSSETSGYGRIKPQAAPAVGEAFRLATLELLSDGRFVEALSKASTSAKPSHVTTLTIRRCAGKLTLPADMKVAISSSVTVRAGRAVGSAVVISRDGYAVTAAHVVEGITEVQVVFESGLSLPASVVRVDSASDLALLRIGGEGFSCLPVRTSDLPPIGAEIYAVGTPWGEEFSFSVARGIVSAYRTLNGTDYIQTDAALNPGNSGGPILDTTGQVFGIVSWKISARGVEGLAFCIPIRLVAERLSVAWVD